jgi:hypothetical protein
MRWDAPRDAPVERGRLEATAACADGAAFIPHSSVFTTHPPWSTERLLSADVVGATRRTPPSMTAWLSRAPAARRVVSIRSVYAVVPWTLKQACLAQHSYSTPCTSQSSG